MRPDTDGLATSHSWSRCCEHGHVLSPVNFVGGVRSWCGGVLSVDGQGTSEWMDGEDQSQVVVAAGGDAVPAAEDRVQGGDGGGFGGVVDAETVVVADVGDDRGVLAASVDVAGG
jgi:hypothetical protein